MASPKLKQNVNVKEEVVLIDVELFDPNPWQPRTLFDDVKHRDLTASVKAQGVLQPVTARVHPDARGRFQLAMGERRLRASKAAGLKTIPTIVKVISDRDMQITALAENVQRDDLTPIAEAMAWRDLVKLYDGDLFEVSREAGKGIDTIKERIALLDLHREVQDFVDSKHLTLACAAILAGLEDSGEQLKYARLAMTRNLTPAKLKAATQQVPKKKGKGDAVSKRVDGDARDDDEDESGGQRPEPEPKQGQASLQRVGMALLNCTTTLQSFRADSGTSEMVIESLRNRGQNLRDALDEFLTNLDNR